MFRNEILSCLIPYNLAISDNKSRQRETKEDIFSSFFPASSLYVFGALNRLLHLTQSQILSRLVSSQIGSSNFLCSSAHLHTI